MTRRKKTKSATSGNGAGAVSAEVSQCDGVARGTSGSDVALDNAPRCPYTGYSLLGPRPVYPVPAPRPICSSSALRSVHPPQGPRLVHASPESHPVTGLRPATASSGPRPVPPKQASQLGHKAASGSLPIKTSTEPHPVTASCDRNIIKTSSTNSSTQSEVDSSVISVSPTNNSDSKDIKSNKKPKQPYKLKVTHETKQVNIYPRQPMLMVERLKNLEHHVGVLTEAVGRRPSVYPHGRRVRFVPETEAEYTTIQRYLARIEAQERIAWCSYSLPPGNSLKVNIKVKVVERIKIADDLTKLKLEDEKNAKPSETDKKDAVENGIKAAKSTTRDKCVSTSNSVPNNKNNAINQKSTSSSGQLDFKTKGKQQAAAKDKLVAVTGSVQRARKNISTASANHSAVKPGPAGSKPKKTTETDKTSSGLKTEQNERDNKLRIVGVVRTNKLTF